MFSITNYSDHPTRIGFTVFRFREKQRAEYFQALLTEENIWFESSEDDSLFLFGVRKGDFKKVMNANYLVSAKYRKKIIPNIYLRWGVITLITLVIIFAIIGALVKT